MGGVGQRGFDPNPVALTLEPLQVQVGHHALRALEAGASRQVLAHHAAIVDQLESELGVRERRRQTDVGDLQGLRLSRAQELPPSGDVVEELLDVEGRPSGAARVLHARLATAVDADLRALDGVPRAGEDAKLRDGCDRRERFAAEPHGLHAKQVLERADLARRVPPHRQDGVLPIHPDPIVLDEDPLLAALSDLDADGGSLGVQRVLEQLLDDARGSLDHFTRGDLVDERVVEESDPGHAGIATRPSVSRQCAGGYNRPDPQEFSRGVPLRVR